MITRRHELRLVIIVVAVVAAGIFLAGVVMWRLAATAQLDPTIAPTDFDVSRVQAFLERHMLKVPRSEPSRAVDDLQLLLVGNDVVEFRKGAVMVSETKAMTQLAQVTPGALQELLEGRISAKYPYIWSYVMAGSFIVIGNSLSDDPVVAFYNPYFDVALLTKWRFKDHTETTAQPGFKLMEAVPVTGRAFRENRPSVATDKPIWTDSEALFEVRLVNAAQGFVATFEERYPPFGRDSVALPADLAARSAAIVVAEERVFALLRWVIDAQNPDAPVNYAAAIKQLKGALAAASSDKLQALLPKDNPQSAAMFFRLEPNIREGMRPYLVVDKNVIFISPIQFPLGFISVYFEPADKGFVPGLMLLFNLGAS
jgi:hypothetical protein